MRAHPKTDFNFFNMGYLLRSLVVLVTLSSTLMSVCQCSPATPELVDIDIVQEDDDVDNEQGVLRRSGVTVGVEKYQALESELAELKQKFEILQDALSALGPAPLEPRGQRTPRSATTSGYFGSVHTGLYGNCTCRGEPGPMGPPGLPGRDGRDGRDAPMPCSQGSAAPYTESSGGSGGSTTSGSPHPGSGSYVRWGRTTCPDGSLLVYEGVIGGSMHDQTGNGANYLCLPLEPIYDPDFSIGGLQGGSFVYGAEYEISSAYTNEPWSNSRLHNNGPPCAVCLAQGRPTVLMVPARNVCPSPDWTLDYQGKLMSAHYTHSRTEYICVDDDSEVIPRTSGTNANGALLYIVEGRCIHGNSLPCGPYVDGYELTCAVCSQ